MRKPRDDSAWNRLSSEQRETLEEWLFEEQQGYADVLVRAQKEFGLEGTRASLGRYYRRRARERQLVEVVAAQATADEINQLPVNLDSLRQSVLKLVAQAALRSGMERPDALKDLESLAKLLLQSEVNDLRRERMKMADRCFHYEAIVAARKDLPQFSAYLAALREDGKLDAVVIKERLKAVLFPPDPVATDFKKVIDAASERRHEAKLNQLMVVLFGEDFPSAGDQKAVEPAPAEAAK